MLPSTECDLSQRTIKQFKLGHESLSTPSSKSLEHAVDTSFKLCVKKRRGRGNTGGTHKVKASCHEESQYYDRGKRIAKLIFSA